MSALTESLVIQRPDKAAVQLMLLCHGLGADAHDMLPLGKVLAAEFPRACIISLAATEACDFGSGRQWFSVREMDETQRPARVAAALPAFLAAVAHWQQETGLDVEATALIGFSQGAIMALEAAQQQPVPAGRVVALAGRYARLPERAAAEVTHFFLHGKEDAVIAYGHTVAAAERLRALGGDFTADVLPFVGHEINGEMAALLVERLTGTIPRRTWDAALKAAQTS